MPHQVILMGLFLFVNKGTAIMETHLLPSFEDSILKESIDIGIDMAEIGLDSLLSNGLLKEIPFFNTFYKISNIAVSVHDRFFLQKALTFIQEVNQGKASAADRLAHKQELDSNPKKQNKELSFVLASIDRHFQICKSKILARFYTAYIDPSNDYNWSDFCVLAEILDQISIFDFNAFAYIKRKKKANVFSEISLFHAQRLENCGVAYMTSYNAKSRTISLTPQGLIFYELGQIEEFTEQEENNK